MPDELTIEDLERHSGLPVRTLHYYMQEGLLPGPEKRGKYASYAQEHLDRLDLILILKEMHLPLKEIRALLDSLTPAEIQHYRDDQEDLLMKLKAAKPDQTPPASTPAGSSSALDYIKSLEEAHGMLRELREDQTNYSNNVLRAEPYFSLGAPSVTQPVQEERWRRIVIADGIELHTRETRDKETVYKIKRLLSFARSLFER